MGACMQEQIDSLKQAAEKLRSLPDMKDLSAGTILGSLQATVNNQQVRGQCAVGLAGCVTEHDWTTCGYMADAGIRSSSAAPPTAVLALLLCPCPDLTHPAVWRLHCTCALETQASNGQTHDKFLLTCSACTVFCRRRRSTSSQPHWHTSR
jgi:hypothetical protein